jgi:hypothetical protein
LNSLAHQIAAAGAGHGAAVIKDVRTDYNGNLLANAVLYLRPDRPGKIEVSRRPDREVIFSARQRARHSDGAAQI